MISSETLLPFRKKQKKKEAKAAKKAEKAAKEKKEKYTGKKAKEVQAEYDAKLAELLLMLMDKFTFEGVENSWTKVCYYYNNINAQNPF